MYTRFFRWIVTFSLFIGFILLIHLLPEPAVGAGPWYVTPGGDDSNDCLSPGTPCETIQGAIEKASSGDVINVAEGTYTDSTIVATIDKDLSLLGGWDLTFSSQTGFSILDGEREYQVMSVQNVITASIERFIITKGSVGGISNSGYLTLSSSTVSGNERNGILNSRDLTINNCIIENNLGDDGGGIRNLGLGILTINNSLIRNNTAKYSGGGIRNEGTLNINNSTISLNSATNGGGIGNIDGTLTISSSTISENNSTKGGGILIHDGVVTVQNSIIATNIADNGNDCSGTLNSSGYNLIGDTTNCDFSSSSGDLTDVDPMLGTFIGPSQTPFYQPLLASSPAIDAGNPTDCLDHTGAVLATDQRGLLRVGTCDIGAYEFAPPGPASQISAIGGTPQRTAPSSEFELPLHAAVMDDVGSPVESVLVEFNAPMSGPSGTFTSSGTETTSGTTNESGIAETSIFIANAEAGSYGVVASATCIPGSTEFQLTNIFWYVATTGDDENSCQTVGEPCASINGVLTKISFYPGDTILVASGTYTGTGDEVANIKLDCSLSGGWNETFTIQDDYTTMDGENLRPVFLVQSPRVVFIEKFILQNGAATTSGGGINNRGTLTLSNSEIRHNSANSSGGGIYNFETLYIHGSSITGNEAGVHGGGIYNYGTLHVNNSTISGNTADDDDGGGIYTRGPLTVNSSTITGNISGSYAGGVFRYGYGEGSAVVHNSILEGNQAPMCPESANVDSGGHNIIGENGYCSWESSTGDIFGEDANIGPLVGLPGYHPLTFVSPAINAGDPSGCLDHSGALLTTDQRGAPRTDRCDIGSYEAQSSKEVSDGEALPGDILSFTIHFRNWYDTPRSYSVSDTLPEELSYVEGTLSATFGTPNHSAGVITWSDTVDPAQEVSITFDAEVGAILGPLVNSAVINDGSEDEIRSATLTVDAPICSVTKYAENPVFDVGAPGSWDEYWVWNPSVLHDDSTYWMWYSGYGSSDMFQIGLATSPNGISWTRNESNPVLTPSQSWEINGVSGPSVILDGTTFKMWYTGVDELGVARIGYATSSDGILWTKYADNPVLDVGAGGSWEDEDISVPTVIKVEDTYHLWYTGFDGSTSRIGYASSSDGIAWVKDANNPILDVGDVGDWDWLTVYSPDVVKVGDTFRMWYSGETLPPAWQTGYAESTDGSQWTRKGLSIPEGQTGSFDEFSADHASVLVEGSDYSIWYGGIDSEETYTIGLATAQTCRPPAYTMYMPIIMKHYAGTQTCPPDYLDDFSDPTSGWLIYEDAEVKFGYTDDQYQIWLKTAEDGAWITPGAKASDFTVAVSARRTSGWDGTYGVLFGISQDWSEFYEVSIDEDYYMIWKFNSGWSLLTWNTSTDIQTGTAWNRIKVTRDGNAISLYINDQFQTTLYDSSFTDFRRIGLVAYSTSSSGRDFRFDDFAIYPISCDPGMASALAIDWGEAEIGPGLPHPPPRE